MLCGSCSASSRVPPEWHCWSDAEDDGTTAPRTGHTHGEGGLSWESFTVGWRESVGDRIENVHVLAIFPGPAQLLIACSTEKHERAKERGLVCNIHIFLNPHTCNMCGNTHSSSGLAGHQNHLRIPTDTRRQYAKVKPSYAITYATHTDSMQSHGILCSHRVALFLYVRINTYSFN